MSVARSSIYIQENEGQILFLARKLGGSIHNTNAMEKSPSREANSVSFSDTIPSFCATHNIYVRCCSHNSPIPGCILSQINPVYSLPSYLFKIHFNIILPFTPISSSGFLPSIFRTKIPARISVLSQSCNMPTQIALHRGYYEPRSSSLCDTAVKEMYAHAGNRTPVQTSP